MPKEKTVKTGKKKTNNKKSINAENVLKEVVNKVRKGEKINLQEIQMKHGYSKTSAKSMKATMTSTYKKGMKTIVQRLEAERTRAISAMAGKINKAKYRDLVDATDKLTKNIELLSGRDTSRVGGLVDDIFDKL